MSPRELLIIDDDEAIHEGLAAFCRERNILALSASDGEEGLRILTENPSVHAVLCDIRIPGRDGLDILKEIKLRDPRIQVILMTAYGEKKLAIQALRYGADDFLEKPIRLPDLGKILDRSFSRIRMQSFATRWQQLLEHLPVGFLRCSAEGKVQSVTPGSELMLGMKAQAIIGRVLWKLPELRRTRVLLSDSEQNSIEIQIEDRWLIVQRVMTEEEQDQTSYLFALTDVSEQKSLQSELRGLTLEFEKKVEERTHSLSEEIEFSQRLLDTADVFIAYFSADGRLERLNKFAEDFLGKPRDEAATMFASFVKNKSSKLAGVFDHRSRDDVSGMIADLPVPDGSFRVFSWSTRRLRESAGKFGRLIIGIEITEQKQLEATLQNYTSHLEEVVKARSTQLQQKDRQLFHTARLASLGEITAGITHELKQPLNVISITADLVRLLHKNGTLTDELLHSNLQKIRNTVDRMATTINHLRGFTHVDSSSFAELSLKDAINGAMSILGEQIRLEAIDIDVDIPANLPPVKAAKNQIEQVLVNLLQNARDAIIELPAADSIGNGADRPKLIAIRGGTLSERGQVYVEVSDTGVGMTQEVVDRIFEPFYTTKDSDRGTGLGLSISLEIIRSHGGEILVESEVERGSSFRVVLPEISVADDPVEANIVAKKQ